MSVEALIAIGASHSLFLREWSIFSLNTPILSLFALHRQICQVSSVIEDCTPQLRFRMCFGAVYLVCAGMGIRIDIWHCDVVFGLIGFIFIASACLCTVFAKHPYRICAFSFLKIFDAAFHALQHCQLYTLLLDVSNIRLLARTLPYLHILLLNDSDIEIYI